MKNTQLEVKIKKNIEVQNLIPNVKLISLLKQSTTL